MIYTSFMVMFVAQHFLLSRQAKTSTLGQVVRMSDAEIETMFRMFAGPTRTARRFARTVAAWTPTERAGRTVRFGSGANTRNVARTSPLPAGRFSPAGAPLRSYLLAVAIFCNEVKGKSTPRSPATGCRKNAQAPMLAQLAKRWRGI